MKYLNNLWILFLISNTCWALYYPNNYGQQRQILQQDQLQQQFVQQDQLQQQIQQLQQQLQLLQQQQQQDLKRPAKPANLNIILPKNVIDDFEYIPTVQGYKFSYKFPDGSRREENAYITGLRMDDYARLDSKTTDLTAVGVGGRPKMMLKNRKLSASSLKSLAG